MPTVCASANWRKSMACAIALRMRTSESSGSLVWMSIAVSDRPGDDSTTAPLDVISSMRRGDTVETTSIWPA